MNVKNKIVLVTGAAKGIGLATVKRLLKKDAKVYIYPNLNGLGLGLFIFFCFLISVFYENNSGLLISIVIFFVFFISIFISHQNISKLDFICKDEYLVEAETINSISFQILNSSKEKKINIDIEYNKKNVGNYNFNWVYYIVIKL